MCLFAGTEAAVCPEHALKRGGADDALLSTFSAATMASVKFVRLQTDGGAMLIPVVCRRFPLTAEAGDVDFSSYVSIALK